MKYKWPEYLSAVQVRIARPTDKMDEIVRFYRDGLGLAISEKRDHHRRSGWLANCIDEYRRDLKNAFREERYLLPAAPWQSRTTYRHLTIVFSRPEPK